MKKSLLLISALFSAILLTGCGQNKNENDQSNPDTEIPEPPKYTEPSPEYVSTCNEIREMLTFVDDPETELVDWEFYVFPEDKEYVSVYTCSFFIDNDELYGSSTHYLNDVADKDLVIHFPKADKFTKNERIVGYSDSTLGDNVLFGTVDPENYLEGNGFDLEKGELQLTDEKLLEYEIDADKLLAFLLKSLKVHTAYDIEALGFTSFII